MLKLLTVAALAVTSIVATPAAAQQAPADITYSFDGIFDPSGLGNSTVPYKFLLGLLDYNSTTNRIDQFAFGFGDATYSVSNITQLAFPGGILIGSPSFEVAAGHDNFFLELGVDSSGVLTSIPPTGSITFDYSTTGSPGVYQATALSVAPADTHFVPSVPEPITWAMMLVGFGGMGLAMRRKRTPALAVA